MYIAKHWYRKLDIKVLPPYAGEHVMNGQPELGNPQWIKQRKALWPHIKRSLALIGQTRPTEEKWYKDFFITGDWQPVPKDYDKGVNLRLLIWLWLHPDPSWERMKKMFDILALDQRSEEIKGHVFTFYDRDDFFTYSSNHFYDYLKKKTLSDYGMFGGRERLMYRFFQSSGVYVDKRMRLVETNHHFFHQNMMTLDDYCDEFVVKNLFMLNGLKDSKKNIYLYNRFQPFQYYLDDWAASITDEVQFYTPRLDEMSDAVAEFCSGNKKRLKDPDPQNLKLAKKLFGMFQQMNLHPQIDAAWKAACEQHKIPCGDLDFALPEPMQAVVLDY